MVSRETKVFDPADGFGNVSDLREICDVTLALRDRQWWLFAAGQRAGSTSTQLYSAFLPSGAPLSADGWQIATRSDDPASASELAENIRSAPWDRNGGRHCPSWVRGFDPRSGRWVERIYYAGAADHVWGPYTIGYLEWNGDRWIDLPEPVFTAAEPWEHGSVFEPNVIYADGRWRMWYVAGSNYENYLVHGHADSADGATEWSEHRIFAPEEMKMFDFAVTAAADGYEAVFSRVGLAPEVSASNGLWWCRADFPSANLADWSEPVQMMTASDRGWHSGPWKPCLRLDDRLAGRRIVFFNGNYKIDAPGPFPYVFTAGCLEIDGIPHPA